MRLRYDNNDIHRRLRPSGSDAARIFERAEQVRVESIGSRRMVGVEKNIYAMLENRCYAKAPDPSAEVDKTAHDILLSEAIGLLIYKKLTGKELPDCAEPILKNWQGYIYEHIGTQLENIELSLIHISEPTRPY